MLEAPIAKHKAAAKRELINTVKDKRFVRRGDKGPFKESDDGRSLKRDHQQRAKTKVKRAGRKIGGDK